jgi:hypothetical protein
MHGTYEQNKASVQRWIAKNRDMVLSKKRLGMKRLRTWKSIQIEFLAILL